jgi:hypothetical protein
MPAVQARAATVKDLGNRPVLVLTRQRNDEWFGTDASIRAARQQVEDVWRELNADIASMSSRGTQRLVPDSSHQFPYTHPQAVVSALNEVVDLVRQQPAREDSECCGQR